MTPKINTAEWKEKMLAGIKVFRNLSPEHLRLLGQDCRWLRCDPNESIFHSEDDSTDVFFIVQGRVRVTYYSASGKEVTFWDLSAGDMFGELSAIDSQPRSVSALSMTDTLLVIMTKAQFWDAMRNYPNFAEMIPHRLTRLIRVLMERVIEFSTLSARDRIRAELLRLACEGIPTKDGVVIDPPPTHSEIASRIGTSRQVVKQELNYLARIGLIEKLQRDRTLIIRDVEALREKVLDVHERYGLQAELSSKPQSKAVRELPVADRGILEQAYTAVDQLERAAIAATTETEALIDRIDARLQGIAERQSKIRAWLKNQ